MQQFSIDETETKLENAQIMTILTIDVMAQTDCSSDSPSPSVESLAGHDDIPTNYNVTCLPDNRLTVAFEFNEPILGQFQALVADMKYYLVSVGNQSSILFFSGAHPGKEPIIIKLVSASDQSMVFEESYTPPVCGIN